jgi:hypothetical protein
MFKDRGGTNVHDEERSGPPSVVSDDLVQSADQKFVKDGASQFQNVRVNFHKCHALFITVALGYQKFCARWVPKMLMGAHKTQRMVSALTLFRAIPQRWR